MGIRPRRTDLPFPDPQRPFPQVLDDPRGGLVLVDWIGQDSDPMHIDHWFDEAEIWREARGPHLLAYEGGREQDGLLFAYQAHVPSWSLRQVLRAAYTRVSMPISCAALVVSEMLAGIHELHTTELDGTAFGFLHRSLQTEVVHVGQDGVTRVLVPAPLPTASAQRHRSGNLQYVSPELVQGAAISPRSDLYSCGVIFWEMLTGERAFRSDSDMEMIERIRAGDLPSASALRSELSPELDALVRRATSLSPHHRPATANELRGELLALVEPAPPAELLAWVISLGAPMVHEEMPQYHARPWTAPLPDDTDEAPRLGYRDNWVRPAYARPATVRPALAPRSSWLRALWRRLRGR